MAPCDHRAGIGMARCAQGTGRSAGASQRHAVDRQDGTVEPASGTVFVVLMAGRDRALGTGQSGGAPRRHAGHCALYVHCGARIGYSVEGGDVGCEDPSGPPPGYCAS